MSRSLTAAARRRYAPHSLCVLWSSAVSRTAAERFADVVAGRWERAAIELEEELRARGPALSWPERTVVPRPPGPRVRRAAAREASPSRLEEPLVSPDPEVVAEAGPEASPLERGEPRPRTRSGRASPPRSASWRGLHESPTGSRGTLGHAAEAANDGLDVEHPAATEGGAALPSLPRSAPAEFARGVSEALTRSDAAAVPPAGRTPLERAGMAASPRGGVAASARSAPAGREKQAGASMPRPDFSGHDARPWDAAEDVDEAARRRFEAWTLERRWRDDALAEWKMRGF